jgi:hypothetical protein
MWSNRCRSLGSIETWKWPGRIPQTAGNGIAAILKQPEEAFVKRQE